MKRRILYPVFVVIALAIIYFAIEPYLHQFFELNRIQEAEYRLYYFSFNLLVTIVIAVIIYIEGKYNGGVQAVSGLLMLNALMDFSRINVYPDVPIASYVVSFFSGILILAFGLITIKKAIFKKGAGTFFTLLGAVYMLRFPMFIDVLYFYFKKYARNISPADGYYFGTLYINYLIIFLGLIALDSVIRENIAMSRYSKQMK